jgi:hydrocephalus-inducing protein
VENLTKDETRWIIPAETTLKLYVNFFSKKPGQFDSVFTFDNSFNLKKTVISIVGKTDFPSLSNIPKNIFWNVKKSRPSAKPECYLSKTFVTSENVYDFGPLLIGKSS